MVVVIVDDAVDAVEIAAVDLHYYYYHNQRLIVVVVCVCCE